MTFWEKQQRGNEDSPLADPANPRKIHNVTVLCFMNLIIIVTAFSSPPNVFSCRRVIYYLLFGQ